MLIVRELTFCDIRGAEGGTGSRRAGNLVGRGARVPNGQKDAENLAGMGSGGVERRDGVWVVPIGCLKP